MHSKYFAALFLFLAAPVAYATPMSDFIERMHEEPVLMYQCYRNATSFEDPAATNLTILWDGQGYPANESMAHVTYNEPGSQVETTGCYAYAVAEVLPADMYSHPATTVCPTFCERFDANVTYVSEDDYTILTALGKSVELYLLEAPYNENAYYFRQYVTPSGPTSMKIYDTSPTCVNAIALRTEVCPDPCDLEYTR